MVNLAVGREADFSKICHILPCKQLQNYGNYSDFDFVKSSCSFQIPFIHSSHKTWFSSQLWLPKRGTYLASTALSTKAAYVNYAVHPKNVHHAKVVKYGSFRKVVALTQCETLLEKWVPKEETEGMSYSPQNASFCAKKGWAADLSLSRQGQAGPPRSNWSAPAVYRKCMYSVG